MLVPGSPKPLLQTRPQVSSFEGCTTKYVIKLYFKDEKPTKQRLKVVFEMMRIALLLDVSTVSAVIDVSNGKLIVPRPLAEDLLPLLEAQALAFTHLWKAVAAKIPAAH